MAGRFTVTDPDLKQLTFDVVEAAFKDMGVSNITISVADPEGWAELPMVAINLTSDSESNAHIGSSLDDELEQDEGQVYAGVSAIFSQVVEVTLWCQNKLERDRVGKLLKQALFLYGQGTSGHPGPYVTTPGVAEVRITGGADQGIVDTQGQFAPHALYLRTYFVSAVTELSGQEPSGEPVTDVIVQSGAFEVDLNFDQEDDQRPTL